MRKRRFVLLLKLSKIKRKHLQQPKKQVERITKPQLTVAAIKEKLSNMDDLIIKELTIQGEIVFLIYLSSLVEVKNLQRLIYEPLNQAYEREPEDIFKNSDKILNDDVDQAVYDVVSGHSLLFFTNRQLVIKFFTLSDVNRSVAAPENETTVMGPQDSFVENLSLNIALVKTRIRSHHLKMKEFILGTETNNTVAVLYMDNIANKENVDRVISRIQHIEFHGFSGFPMLKQMLEDKPLSPFPQFGITVRTDNTMAGLLDGKIIVMMNGSPEAAILPATFMDFLITPEDHYNRWTTATLLRGLRFVGFFISIFLTSTYVSVLTFHPEMLPPQLLTILAESRAQVPFPPLFEVMLIELVIEVLREAGARMPTKIGQTIGIVGGIVIGTAAVEAGLASNVLIVLVAITALLSFIPPNFLMSNAIRLVRYFFIIGAGVFGMFGQMVVLAWMINHISNLTSLGTPYISPVIPRKWSDLLNSVLRAPSKYVKERSGMARAKKKLVRPVEEE